jgi:ABC-type polysaccharide/polyol phosphate export permease
VPIAYPFAIVPQEFRNLYQFNPVAALVLACRNILLDGIAPPNSLLIKLAISSTFVFLVGLFAFRRLKWAIYDHL